MPENLDDVALAAAENIKIATAGITAKRFLNLQRQNGHATAHVGGRTSTDTHKRSTVPGSSATKNFQNPRQGMPIDIGIHDHPSISFPQLAVFAANQKNDPEQLRALGWPSTPTNPNAKEAMGRIGKLYPIEKTKC